MITNNKEMGSNIRKLRKTLKMTQRDLADKVGVSQGYIADLENGKLSPSLKTLDKILKTLGIPQNFLEEPVWSKRLTDLRTKKDLSMSELASKINIDSNTMRLYENGIGKPDIEIFTKIADYFEVSIDYLLGKTNKPDTVILTEDNLPKELSEKGITYIEVSKECKKTGLTNEQIQGVLDSIDSVENDTMLIDKLPNTYEVSNNILNQVKDKFSDKELEILQEINGIPELSILFHDLKDAPVHKIKQLLAMWEVIKKDFDSIPDKEEE